MCQQCINKLQETLDAEALKPVPGTILIHFDDEPCNVGVLLTAAEIQSGLHESMNEQCWCHPFCIEPSDTRTAAEIWRDATLVRSIVH